MEQVFFFLPSQQNTAVEQLHHVLCLLFNIEYMFSISALEIEFCIQASFSLLLILLGLILTRCIAQCLYPHWPANSSDWLALSALSENICNATHSSYMEHNTHRKSDSLSIDRLQSVLEECTALSL